LRNVGGWTAAKKSGEKRSAKSGTRLFPWFVMFRRQADDYGDLRALSIVGGGGDRMNRFLFCKQQNETPDGEEANGNVQKTHDIKMCINVVITLLGLWDRLERTSACRT